MAANVFQHDTNTHGTWLSHAHTRQSFFVTSRRKWSEWKTNRSAVITGLFRRKRQGGGSLKPCDPKMDFKKTKRLFKIVLRSQRSGWFSIPTIFDVWCMLSQSRGTLASRYVYLRIPSSVLSASTHFIVRVLSACVICTLPHLGIL